MAVHGRIIFINSISRNAKIVPYPYLPFYVILTAMIQPPSILFQIVLMFRFVSLIGPAGEA